MTKTDQPIKRRTFLKGTGIAGAAALVGACDNGGQSRGGGAPAIVTRKRNLKMVTTWPKNFPGTGTAAERLAKRIREGTDGALSIQVYAGGELVPAFGAFDAVSQGKADLYHGAEYYWQGKSQAFNYFAAVPLGMMATEMNAWIYHGGGQELWDELSAGFNIKPFMAGNTGVQMGGWYKKEISKLDDFKGLRIRMPGLGGEVMKRLGATPVTRSGGEIFLALSQGNIDASEWIGPWNDIAFGFHTIAEHYYYPGIHEPGAVLSAGMNKDVWEELTPAQQSIVSNAMAAENDYTLAEFNLENARALRALRDEHNVIPKPFSERILAEMARVSLEVLEETAARDPFTQKVYDSFMAARKDAIDWGRISDRAFAEARSK